MINQIGQLTERRNGFAGWPNHRTTIEVLSMKLSMQRADQSIPKGTPFSIQFVVPNLLNTKFSHV